MSRAKTILIADPDHAAVKYVTLLLENEGFRVIEARDGDDTLAKLRETRVDLVLLEIPMPGKNGYQVCRAIKSDELLRSLPVLFVSAKSQASDRFWAKRVGADGFVARPFDPAELLREIHAVLQSSQKPTPAPKR
jgi:twitching motility two-component system response regulator PilH